MAEDIVQQMHQIGEIIAQLKIRRSDESTALTDQYGYLKFDRSEVKCNSRLSQYIRLAYETDPYAVVKFLERAWHLPRPDLIISVTGGGRRCRMSAHLRKTFQRGLVLAASTTNAWLITAGTNAGVIKEVGQALNTYRYKTRSHGLEIPCIGIASWRFILSNEQLTMKPVTDRSRSSSLHDGRESIRSYLVEGQHENDRCALERNHSHFLLFDGPSSNDDRLLFERAAIEKCSRQIYSTGQETIPMVMLLVEGGLFSLRTVSLSLQSRTPLLVLKGSGRAADLLADLHAYFSPMADVHSKWTCCERSVLQSIFERNRFDRIDEDLCDVLFAQRDLITIFQFDGEKSHCYLEEAILQSLFNANKSSNNDQQSRVNQLKLTMAWNKLDYAQKSLLTDRTISDWTDEELTEALFEALRRDQFHFVDLLLEYGTSLEKLTVDRLDQLYALDELNRLPVENHSDEEIVRREDFYRSYSLHHPHFDRTRPLGERAKREFFLWAIFFDRFQLGRYLCSHTWNSFVSPLIGARIYRQASGMSLHSETREDYHRKANQFDHDAMSIISRCFQSDEHFAVELLKTKASSYDQIQPLELAEQANCRVFLSSKAVQRSLDHQWFGRINSKRRAIHLRIFLCSLLPLFAVYLPYVHEERRVSRLISKSDSIVLSERRRKSSLARRTVIETNMRLRPIDKLIYFFEAPIVRFYYNVIFFIAYLGLFSYVVLVEYYPLNVQSTLIVSKPELVLHWCIWSLILDDLAQFLRQGSREYFSDMWNWIDFMAIVLYLFTLLTRVIFIEHFFILSKIFLCLDLILWFVGTLHLFAAFEQLGPKLVMIFKTMKDLLFFVCFLWIFLCAFSITSWALISSASQVNWIYDDQGRLINVTRNYDDNQQRTGRIFRDLINHGVWKIFGQVDPIVGTDFYSDVAFVLTIVFVAIANVLLLNVLVALFNVTIQNVQSDAHDLWRYQRFLIVNEYSKKTPLPTPFTVFYYLFCSTRFLFNRLRIFRKRQRTITSDTLLEQIATEHDQFEQELQITDEMRRESAIADDYWYQVFQSTLTDRTQLVLQKLEDKLAHLITSDDEKDTAPKIGDHLHEQIKHQTDV